MMAIICWGVFVLGGWLMATQVPQMGVNGPWMMCTIYIILVGLISWWRWNAGVWQRIRLFAHAAPSGAAGAMSNAVLEVEAPDEAPVPATPMGLASNG